MWVTPLWPARGTSAASQLREAPAVPCVATTRPCRRTRQRNAAGASVGNRSDWPGNGVPAWTIATVTTTESNGETLRDAMVCSAVIRWAAMTIGSTERCGYAPCACFPRIVACQPLAAANIGPEMKPTLPTSISASACSPKTASGFGFAKAPYIGIELSNEVIALMKRVKAAFDPNGILNPGKIFP